MKFTTFSTIALAIVAATSGAAFAADAGLTREQVLAELRQAQASGDVIGDNDSGQTLRAMYPSQYLAVEIAGSKTRTEVKAELKEALRTGDIVANSEHGQTLNRLYPGNYRKTVN